MDLGELIDWLRDVLRKETGEIRSVEPAVTEQNDICREGLRVDLTTGETFVVWVEGPS